MHVWASKDSINVPACQAAQLVTTLRSAQPITRSSASVQLFKGW